LRLVAGGWFLVREKYCWLVADKPSEQGDGLSPATARQSFTVFFLCWCRLVTQKTLIGTLPLELDAMLDCCLPVVYRNKKKEAGHRACEANEELNHWRFLFRYAR
jgi:hypothetical protein